MVYSYSGKLHSNLDNLELHEPAKINLKKKNVEWKKAREDAIMQSLKH